MKRIVFLVALIFHSAQATEKCESERPVDTPNGLLVQEVCSTTIEVPVPTGNINPNNRIGHRYTYTLKLGNAPLIRDSYLSLQDLDRKKGLRIYSNGGTALYLVDLNQNPPLIFKFGVRMSTNEFEYASWGKKNSVIAIKDNTKFIYQDGRLIPPRNVDYAALDSSLIQYRTDGSIYKMPDLTGFIPFVEKLALPLH
jgi:hypothetical protein